MKKSGITLIALVITIIVLLILAGVTLNTLMGENGVLKQATGAKDMTEKTGTREEIQTALLSRKIGTDKMLVEDLREQIPGATIETVSGATDMCYVTKNGVTVTVYEDGDILERKSRKMGWNFY